MSRLKVKCFFPTFCKIRLYAHVLLHGHSAGLFCFGSLTWLRCDLQRKCLNMRSETIVIGLKFNSREEKHSYQRCRKLSSLILSHLGSVVIEWAQLHEKGTGTFQRFKFVTFLQFCFVCFLQFYNDVKILKAAKGKSADFWWFLWSREFKRSPKSAQTA